MKLSSLFTLITPRILAAAAASRNAMPRRATSPSCPAWCLRRLDPYFAAIYDGRSCTNCSRCAFGARLLHAGCLLLTNAKTFFAGGGNWPYV